MRAGLLDIYVALDKCGMSALTLGTACSGSDVVAPTLTLIAAFWHQQFALPIDFDHRFSCEVVPEKREWIQAHFTVPHIFPDSQRG